MNSKIEIIDNFLEENTFIGIQNFVMGDEFPWYFNDFKSDGNDIHNYQFTHTIIREGQIQSEFIQHMDSFFKLLEIKEIFRIKINLTTKTEKFFNHLYHTDFKDCTTAIFYMNTNNGKTIFKQGEEVNSVANRMVIFNSNLEHAATSHTDKKTRVVINFNYV